MPAPRAALADIHDKKLDHRGAHRIGRDGHLMSPNDACKLPKVETCTCSESVPDEPEKHVVQAAPFIVVQPVVVNEAPVFLEKVSEPDVVVVPIIAPIVEQIVEKKQEPKIIVVEKKSRKEEKKQ
jgi:hypothetical protein